MRRVREKNTRLVLAMLEHHHHNRSLAAACGVGEHTISRIVNQRQDPTPETKLRIARALKRPVQDLFGKECGV